MNLNSPTSAQADDQPCRLKLEQSLLALLSGNGENARPVWFGLDVKSYSGLRDLLKHRPYDAVRCEIGGTTLTVEITSDPARHGELPDPDAMRYGTYDLNGFRDWFYNLLRRSGMTPRPSAPVANSRQPQTATVRPDLRSRPMFNNKKRRR